MAEGLTRHYLGDYFEVYSAGTEPRRINRNAIKVLSELSIDISSQQSKNVESLISKEFELVVTLCDDAKESCPLFPGKTEVVHISFMDPAGAAGESEEILDMFRNVRDDIRVRLLSYLKEKYSIVQES